MTDSKIAILAYSGGLDTSVCIKWLQEEYGYDVIAVVGEVGQEHEGLEEVRSKALSTGAIECYVVDMREEFANDYLTKEIMANGLYENKYPLLSALSRPLISKHLVDIAHKHGATTIAHGCTGKGNDQVRFETSIMALDPSLSIVAPVREWDLKTRAEEMDWALKRGIPVPTTKDSPYSIDDNVWGRAIECGVLENPWNEPPADIYTMTADPVCAPNEPEYLVVSFENGVPIALNGEQKSLLDIVYETNEIAGRHGYGRLDMIENRLVGVKSRECYEAPGGLALIEAHKALEDLCLARDVLHFKLGLEQKWAAEVYNGQWFSPLKEALDAFMAQTQEGLNGDVRLRFYKGNCTVVGRRSEHSLYSEALATYDDGDIFDHTSAKGFINLYALPTKTWAQVQKGE